MSDELVDQRRRKLAALRDEGVEPFPHAFAGVAPIADVKAPYEELPAGEETEARARVAGRLAARRGQGKAAFLDLVDRSGRIQLHARADVLGQESLDRLVSLDLGDLVGADGTVFRTRRGELSLKLDDWTLLAKSLRPPPEKHHGLHGRRDPLPPARARPDGQRGVARGVHRAREGDHRDPPRSSTPRASSRSRRRSCSRSTAAAPARPFTTHHNALDRTLYLRIATELYLKRLIVGGLERVYEIGKDFRNEGVSPKHNPEFTVLEWYEAYADYEDIAARCEQLVATVAARARRDRVRTPLAPRDARRGDRVAHGHRRLRPPRRRRAAGGDGRERASIRPSTRRPGRGSSTTCSRSTSSRR